MTGFTAIGAVHFLDLIGGRGGCGVGWWREKVLPKTVSAEDVHNDVCLWLRAAFVAVLRGYSFVAMKNFECPLTGSLHKTLSNGASVLQNVCHRPASPLHSLKLKEPGKVFVALGDDLKGQIDIAEKKNFFIDGAICFLVVFSCFLVVHEPEIKVAVFTSSSEVREEVEGGSDNTVQTYIDKVVSDDCKCCYS